MKKSAYLLCLLIVVVFTSSTIMAEGNILDINSAVEDAIKRSATLKSQKNRIEKSQKQFEDSEKNTLQAKSLLELDDRFAYLSNKKDRTIQEQFEYQGLMAAFEKPMTAEQRFPYIQITTLTPLNIAYTEAVLNQNKEVMISSIKLTIYTQYTNLLKLKDAITLQAKLVSNLENNLKAAQAKYKVGKISGKDLEALEINYKKAQIQLRKLKRTMESAVTMLNSAIGRPTNERYTQYKEDNMAVLAYIKPYEAYLTDALKNRAEIISSTQYYKIKSAEFEITQKTYPNEAERVHKDAKYAMEEALNRCEMAKADIELEIFTAYKALEDNLAEWQKAEKQSQEIMRSYNEAYERYKVGQITEKALADLNINQTQMAIQMNNIRRDFWLAQLKLQYASQIGPGNAPQYSMTGGSL